ncbi:MAG: hypothetical protein QF752_13135 [Planctomycetota bacterium]|nr:hypothetical protein [Planctomycetota bacterium]
MRFVVWASLLLFALTGCVEIQENILINKDLSGSIQVKVAFFTQEDEVITPEEFEIQKERQAAKMAEEKEDLRQRLPEGVRIDKYDFRLESPTSMVIEEKISFDHLKLLGKIKAKAPGPDEKDSGPDLQLLRAFRTEETESEIIVEHRLGQKKMPPREGVVEIDMESYVKDRMFYAEVLSTLEVVSTNATRREGNRMIWEVPMKKMLSLEKDLWARIVFKKP